MRREEGRGKRGFTLVELMVSMAVLAVLITIVSVAASGSVASARAHRAEAMRTMLQQGLEAFYAQEGKWPKAIESRIANFPDDVELYQFTAEETDKIFQELVGRAFGKGGSKSAMLDVTGLFVCEASNCGNSNKGCYDQHSKSDAHYCGDGRCRNGVDFWEAVKPEAKRHISLSGMAFGYPGANEGKFRRFFVGYSLKADTVTVLMEPKQKW